MDSILAFGSSSSFVKISHIKFKIAHGGTGLQTELQVMRCQARMQDLHEEHPLAPEKQAFSACLSYPPPESLHKPLYGMYDGIF
jgi:hypothetical protein